MTTKIKTLLLSIIFVLCFASSGWATNYYVDCSLSTGNNDGTSPTDAWQETSSITGLSNGDDLYFKQGTTCKYSDGTLDASIDITWSGNSGSDLSIIGCYVSEGDFDCDGLTKPILDGEDVWPGLSGSATLCTHNGNDSCDGVGSPYACCLTAGPPPTGTCSGCWDHILGTVTDGVDYIKIQDLDVRNAAGYSIQFNYDGSGDSFDYIYVDNNAMSGSYRDGVLFDSVINGEITNNTVVGNGTVQQYDGRRRGLNIQVSNVWSGVTNESLLVSGNVVNGAGVCREGIGIYKGIHNAVIENNVVFDHQAAQIYPSGSCDECIIRNNLVYSTDPTDSDKDGWGIFYLWEDTVGTGYCSEYAGTEDNMRIYNNLVAGCAQGIVVSDACYDEGKQPLNAKIYNNTVVDSRSGGTENSYNYRFANAGSGSGNEFKNNLSVGYAKSYDGEVLGCTTAGWDFQHNAWTDNQTGDCATLTACGSGDCGNIESITPALFKTSGWHTLSAEGVTGQEFRLTSGSTDVIDAGLDLGGSPYADAFDGSNVSGTDFTATPITVAIDNQDLHGDWEIGAWLWDDTASQAHYVDCSDSDSTREGTYNDPFYKISEVNDHSFATGDDLYFKEGTTCTTTNLDAQLIIDWDGSSSAHIEIGCYDGEGSFDCDGNKPILDGNWTFPSGDSAQAIIQNSDDKDGTIKGDYMDITYLKIQKSDTVGITIWSNSSGTAENITISDIDFYRNDDQDFVIQGPVDTVTISDIYSEQASYANITGTSNSACAVVRGYTSNGYPSDITITRLEQKDCGREYINISQVGTGGMVLEDSVFYSSDMDNYGINLWANWEHANQGSITIRNNLFYGLSAADTDIVAIMMGDTDNVEESCNGTNSDGLAEVHDVFIYNNLFAGYSGTDDNDGGAIGFTKGNNCSPKRFEDILIYNNTSVDNDSFLHQDPVANVTITSTVLVKNNIIIREDTSNAKHFYCSSSCSELDNATYDTNFYETTPVSNLGSADSWAGVNKVTGSANLNENDGSDINWRSLTEGAVTGQEFSLLATSDAINVGIDLGSSDCNSTERSYNCAFSGSNVTGTDFTASPITVARENQDSYGIKWEIGAWTHWAYEDEGDGGIIINCNEGEDYGWTCRNNVIQYNTLYDVDETIGLYKQADYNEVKYNTIYWTSAEPRSGMVGIYVASSKFNDIHHNLVYASETEVGLHDGIQINNENARAYCHTGNNDIYNNLVAGTHWGISVLSEKNDGSGTCDTAGVQCDCNQDNNLIYNNTLVDNDVNFVVNYDDSSWSGNEYKNNISATYRTLSDGTTDCSAGGFIFQNNLWHDYEDGNCDDNISCPNTHCENKESANPGLVMTTGWDELTAHTVSGQEFALVVGSDAINTGGTLGAEYDDAFDGTNISGTNFAESPILIDTAPQGNYGSWEMGAWLYPGDVSAYYFSTNGTDDPDTSTTCDLDECTYNNPCKTIECANQIMNSLSPGEHYIVFKEAEDWDSSAEFCNTSLSGTQPCDYLDVTVTGADSSNWAVVGCYEGNNDFSCDLPDGYPIIDGAYAYPTTSDKGLVNVDATGSGDYVEVRELRVTGVNDATNNSGVRVDTADYVKVHSIYAYSNEGEDFAFTAVTNGWLYNNKSYGTYFSPKAGLRIGEDCDGVKVYGNRIKNGHEGIEVYRNDNIEVYNNLIYDCESVLLYCGNCRNSSFHHNLIYQSTDEDWTEPLIVFDIPTQAYTEKGCYMDNVSVFGNMLAAGLYGIQFKMSATGAQSNCFNVSVDVYNNTLVDNDSNFYIETVANNHYDGNIQNNISYTIDGASDHINNCSPFSGATWGYNLWDEAPGSGDCDTGTDTNDVPGLVKTSGWRSLANDGSVSGQDFRLSSDSVAAKGAGVDVGNAVNCSTSATVACGFDGNSYTLTDFGAEPPTVRLVDRDDYDWDIGAWAWVDPDLLPPAGLIILAPPTDVGTIELGPSVETGSINLSGE